MICWRKSCWEVGGTRTMSVSLRVIVVEDYGVICRSVSANEKHNIVAIGGTGSRIGSMTLSPFISIHRVDKEATFPVLCSLSLPDFDECITSLEFIYLAKTPTLLACDTQSLLLLSFKHNELNLLQSVRLHHRKLPLTPSGHQRLGLPQTGRLHRL